MAILKRCLVCKRTKSKNNFRLTRNNCIKCEAKYQRERNKKSPGYTAYMSIIQRCENKKNFNFKYYGALGIKMEIEKSEFIRWYDAGAKKLKRPSVDRINPKGNYNFKNIRMVELSENIGRKSPLYYLRIKAKKAGNLFCSRCKKSKAKTEFGEHERYRCLPCRAEYHRIWRAQKKVSNA